MKLKKIAAGMVLAGLVASGAAQAALVDRGGGLLYDTVLNITWLQDANYAKTSGYDADGRMIWSAAKTWADNLVYGGYSDWRLASNSPVGTVFNLTLSKDGSTDFGFNITSVNSELSYMYYINLGLKGQYDTDGTPRTDWGIFGNATYNGVDRSSFGERDIDSVHNLQAWVYWSGTEYLPGLQAFYFNLVDGGAQGLELESRVELSAWAVRDGDVAATVPEPMSLVLLGMGLAGLAGTRRRKKLARAE